MRPVRCIHLNNLKYKYTNIVQTETTMAVRVLYPMLDNDGRPIGNSQDILTDKPIIWQVLDINGQLFQVVAEGIFDLKNPLHKQWFKANANICFVANAAFPKGIVSIVPLHLVSGNTYEHTPDWARREGVEVLAQLYCWSDTDLVNNSCCSFPVDNKGQLYTNIDPARISHVDTEWMKREDRSDFVTLQHMLECKVAEDNSCIECTLGCTNLGSLVPTTGTYLVDCSAGYIPVREVRVENGLGTFVWVPFMLDSTVTEIRITVRDVQGQPCCERLIRVNRK